MDYATFLLKEFTEKTKAHPAFSVRMFAQQIGISAASLSRIMNRISQPSDLTLSKFEKKFGQTKLKSVNRLPTESLPPPVRGVRRKQMRNLKEEIFSFSLGLRHFALLSLSKTAGFQNDENFMASRLGLSVPEIRQTIAELKSSGVLSFTAAGKWKINPKNMNVHFSFPAGLRSFTEVLEKNLAWYNSLTDENEFKKSDAQCLTVTMNPERISDVRAILQSAREQIAALPKSEADRTDVYQISLFAFPVTVKDHQSSGL